MKKTIVLGTLFVAALMSCSQNNEQQEKERLQEEMNQEVEKLDSLTGVLESSREELEALGDDLRELDSMINDIQQ